MAKNSFVLHLDSLSILDEMPDEMAGQFLKILYKFKNTGELPKMDFAMKIAVTPFVNQFRRDDEKYGNTVEKRSLAGSKGGKQKVANASKSKQKVANVAESDSVSDNDSESVKENESVSVRKKKTGVFIPPTLEEVEEFFVSKGHSKAYAKKAFDHYELGNPPWTDTQGNKVIGWKQKMNTVWVGKKETGIVEAAKPVGNKTHPHEGTAPEHLQLMFNDYDEYLAYCQRYSVTPIPQAY